MMHRRLLFALTALLLVLVPTIAADDLDEDIGPASYASPVHAGCYLASISECKIHVDPFTANVAAGQRLERFQLKANGQLIYDFSTDVSNTPLDDFTPTVVMNDFAAVCGVTYQVSALTKDSGDSGLGVAGLTDPFTCPTRPPTNVTLSGFAAGAFEFGRGWIVLGLAILLIGLSMSRSDLIKLPGRTGS